MISNSCCNDQDTKHIFAEILYEGISDIEFRCNSIE